MLTFQNLQQYANLLHIRQNAARRNVTITFIVFVASVILVLFDALVMEQNIRALVLQIIVVIFFGLGALSSWSHYEILKAITELIDEIEHGSEKERVS